MADATTRLALIKPTIDENKQLAVVNANSDKLDAAVGIQWVTDGSLPALQFNGAVFKELTSGKQFVLKNDGLGGFTKQQLGDTGIWTNLTLATQMGNQAGYPVAQWKQSNNFVYLRGVIRNTAANFSGATVIANAPFPLPTKGTANSSYMLSCYMENTAVPTDYNLRGAINVRTDSPDMRLYIQSITANLVHLDGVFYATD